MLLLVGWGMGVWVGVASGVVSVDGGGYTGVGLLLWVGVVVWAGLLLMVGLVIFFIFFILMLFPVRD